MIKKLKDENLRVLPVRVRRDEQKMLHIVIGPSYKPDYHQEVKNITQQAKEAVDSLKVL